MAEGVGLWLDDYHRGQLADGSLERLVADGLVSGVVLRPAAMVRAMSATSAYPGRQARLPQADVSAEERVHELIAEDARTACTVLEPVFQSTKGMHGWVSLGMAPRLYADAEATVAQARLMTKRVGRPNVMIRIPLAHRGSVAIARLLAEGISVHVTSVFSLRRYAQAVEAYFHGLERATAGGHDASAVTSLVSVDVDGLNAGVDALLDNSADPATARVLRGQAGTATARLVYRRYEESLGCARWRTLVGCGARPQRLLWVSERSQKELRAELDRAERLIAWMTLHALSQPALEALSRCRQLPGDTLSGEHDWARGVFDGLERAGISIDSLTRDMEQEALDQELAVWDRLLTLAQAG
ncbi:transaldolase family protein [Streptomyces minutiscleroticus]|nr:transaldolase family protein [Streptomyces minutiscleroticus]